MPFSVPSALGGGASASQGPLGITVFIANTKPVSDFFTNIGLALNVKTVRAFLENCIGTAFAASQSDCPFLTGFLVSSGRAEMTNDTSGQIIYDAPYATAQEEGFVVGNKFVKGKHYLLPNARMAFQLMTAEMNKFYSDVMKTGKMSAIPTIKLPPSKGPAGRRGRKSGGPHRFTAQRITASGRKSNLYRGPHIIKTKVFRPGTGKSRKQSGRKVNIGSGR